MLQRREQTLAEYLHETTSRAGKARMDRLSAAERKALARKGGLAKAANRQKALKQAKSA